jgi:hypothetical protein
MRQSPYKREWMIQAVAAKFGAHGKFVKIAPNFAQSP